MTTTEFFVHAMIAGCVVGVPAAIAGQLAYTGRSLSPRLLLIVGAVAGFGMSCAILVGVATSWLPIIILGVVLGAVGAVGFALLPLVQRRARR